MAGEVQDIFIRLTKCECGEEVRVRVIEVTLMDRVDTPVGAPEDAPAKCTMINLRGASEPVLYVRETLDEIEALEDAE